MTSDYLIYIGRFQPLHQGHLRTIGQALELAAHASFGTAASATDWWLGPDSDTPRRMPREKFIDHLTTIMIGAIIGTTELLGIRIDRELPIHKAVLREPGEPADS